MDIDIDIVQIYIYIYIYIHFLLYACSDILNELLWVCREAGIDFKEK